MTDKYQNKYRIASARNPNWDYRWNAAYFITICTKNREHFFGKVVDNKMQLSPIGVIADLLWYEIKNHARNIELGEFVVMPNHIHGILILDNPSELLIDKNLDDNKNNYFIQDAIIDDDADNNGNADGDENGDADGDDNGDADGVQTRHALSLSPIKSPIPTPQSEFNIQLNPEIKKTIGHKRLRNPGKNSISTIIGGYKSAVTKHANRLKYEFAWQTRFHDHIIRDDKSFQNISNYIINNPKKWDEDKFYY